MTFLEALAVDGADSHAPMRRVHIGQLRNILRILAFLIIFALFKYRIDFVTKSFKFLNQQI